MHRYTKCAGFKRKRFSSNVYSIGLSLSDALDDSNLSLLNREAGEVDGGADATAIAAFACGGDESCDDFTSSFSAISDKSGSRSIHLFFVVKVFSRH